MAIALVENKKIKEGAEMFGITEKKLKQYVTLWKEQEAVKKGERRGIQRTASDPFGDVARVRRGRPQES